MEGLEREGAQHFSPCEEPFVFKCKRGLHNQSVPCHQRDRTNAYGCNSALTKTLDCGHEASFQCSKKKKVVCRQCNHSQRPLWPPSTLAPAAVGQSDASGSTPSCSTSPWDDDEDLVPISPEEPWETEPSSSSLTGNPNEVDVKRTATDVLPASSAPSTPDPTQIGGIPLPCGHTLENPSKYQRRSLLCPKIVPKECARGHVTKVTCNTDMSQFKCMTIMEGALPPPSCLHYEEGKYLAHPRRCHQVDLTLCYYLCPIMVSTEDGERRLKAPCHLVEKMTALRSEEKRKAVLQKPRDLKRKKEKHKQSVPCHQRSHDDDDDIPLPSPSPCPPPRSAHSIQNEVWAFVQRDDKGREEYKDWLSWYIPRVLLTPSSISVLGRDWQDGIIGKLLDRLEERMMMMTQVVKTSSVLNFLLSQWKTLADPMAQPVEVWERVKKLVQIYHTNFIETRAGSKGPSEEEGLQEAFNSIFRQWCGSWMESTGVVKSKMAKLLAAVDIGTEDKATAMYELILQLSETFLQSVSQNPLHSDEHFCVELIKGLGPYPEIKRAVVWTFLGILATLKDPSCALEVGKCCGDVISELLEDPNILFSRVCGIVQDDEFFAWKTVLKSVFPRPSEMYEINNRIKNPKVKAWFGGLEVQNSPRQGFRDFYHPSPEFDGGLMTLDILKGEEPSSNVTIKSENVVDSSTGSVVSSGNNNSLKRCGGKHNDTTGKRTKM